MKRFVLVVAFAAAPLVFVSAPLAAAGPSPKAKATVEAGQIEDMSARRKLRRHRYLYRGYGGSYAYDRSYPGYYRGVRPGWGYGPDPGDYAWPPFHFKPYW